METKDHKTYDIFISYRRDGGYETAKHLYDLLRLDGYSVSFDIDTLGNGPFDTELYRRIDQCSDFIVILSNGALDRCMDPTVSLENDWLRNEVAYAISKDRNIVPVIGSDFSFPDTLPSDIEKIKYFNGVVYNRAYFDAMYSKLKTFLQSKPERKVSVKIGVLIAFVIAAVLAVLGFIFFSNDDFRHDDGPELIVEKGGEVFIKASLLDSSFVRTDSVVAAAVSPDNYFGIDECMDFGCYNSFHYTDSFVADTCVIVPWGRYVGDYYARSHALIDDPTFNILGEDFYTNTHYPLLDVKLVNNSGETIIIDNLVIAVNESVIDSRPFVVVIESAGVLSFLNQGWTGWNDCKFRFSLSAEKPVTASDDYKFAIDIPSSSALDESDGIFEVNMYDYLKASGVDFNRLNELSIIYSHDEDEIPGWSAYYGTDNDDEMKALDSLKNILAPLQLDCSQSDVYDYDDSGNETTVTGVKYLGFCDPGMYLTGVLDFDNGRQLITVEGFVRVLTSEGYGAPGLNVSRVFDVKFRDEGRNYAINYPVSRILKDGEGGRIVLQLNADKTTRHQFKVKLDNINGRSYESNPVDLLMFKYPM